MRIPYRLLDVFLGLVLVPTASAEDWLQLKYDARHSGDAPDRSVTVPLGLVGAVKTTDAVFTAPVVAGGRVYVVDGSGTAFGFDARTLEPVWKTETRGGAANCNNVSSPLVADGRLHFGTMAGWYYVLDAASGKVVKEIACGEPVFSTPVASGDRVYFVTLGSQVYALKPDGTVCWTWDYVKERTGFTGDRWSAADWLKHKKARVTWRDQFCCAGDMAAYGGRLIVPAGGEILWLEDAGDRGLVRAAGQIPPCAGSERAANFGPSIGQDGTVYQQWDRRDNTGRVEMLWLRDGKLATDHVLGTMTASDMPDSLGFSAVSLRGRDVYRCRPEEGFGLCRHSPGQKAPQPLGGYASIASPILLRDRAVYGGLDGRLYVVPLSGGGEPWSFATAFGKAISAPACVCDGRIYFGCEDGYLYVLGPEGKSPLPKEDLQLAKIRSPLTGKLRRSPLRLVHQLRRLRQFECQRPGDPAAAAHEMDPSFRGEFQALARLRGRAHVSPHGRRAGPGLRAGNRPAVVAAVLARRSRLLHFAAVSRGAPVGAPGRPGAVAPPLPRRGYRRTPLGGPVHRLAQLEPGPAAGHPQEPRHLHVRHGNVRPQRERHLRDAHEQGPKAPRTNRRDRELAL